MCAVVNVSVLHDDVDGDIGVGAWMCRLREDPNAAIVDRRTVRQELRASYCAHPLEFRAVAEVAEIAAFANFTIRNFSQLSNDERG